MPLSPSERDAALLIGIDLDLNLSATGSLATILWLQTMRRESQGVFVLDLFKVGALVMPLALAIALAIGAAFFLT